MVSPSKKRQIKGRVTTGHKLDRKGNYMAGQWNKREERKRYMMAMAVVVGAVTKPANTRLALTHSLSHTYSDQYSLTSALMSSYFPQSLPGVVPTLL